MKKVNKHQLPLKIANTQFRREFIGMGGEPLTAFGDDPNFIVNKQIRGLFCCRVAHTHTVTLSQSVVGMK